jgi:hypothetical protein
VLVDQSWSVGAADEAAMQSLAPEGRDTGEGAAQVQ